ncbi:MAG: ABC transporter permease [Pantoea sp.]|uniref:ABC transporter permease n=1 Tax=Pantoea sp. TaxID=69393 RepID=UPI0023A6AD41|nr:ABC transporter permease [Pantoea sp.]MDE1186860.1 ABC transporter permease [Pantoea sp.]
MSLFSTTTAAGAGRTGPTMPQALRSGRVIVGAGMVLLVLFCALLSPWLAPHDPLEQDLLAIDLPPLFAGGGDPAHLLGTDSLGRDVLSRLLYGARIASYVAVAAGGMTALVGTVLAIAAGYLGGWLDWLVSRAAELWMAFPQVILGVVLMIALGPGVNNVVLSVIVVDWTRFTRVLRSDVMSVARRDYVAAARLAGFTKLQVMVREILPAVAPLLITLLTLEMALAVTIEATLSFIGLSVPADTPAWGVMIADARLQVYQNPWALFFPFAAVLFTVLGLNLLGDGLRRALDPRQQQSRRLEN